MKKSKDTGLVAVVQNDSKLSADDKKEFLSLANIYMGSFNENLSKSSVELSMDTGVDLDTWRKFLTYPSIKRMIDGYVNEQIKKKADNALLTGSGTRDAINVRKAMIEAESSEDNTRYVIMRLPDKLEDLDE